jgi:hypothetical protein
MNTLIKIFFIFALLYLVWHLGRWYGQVERLPQIVYPCDTRVNLYNEYMLKNCLKATYGN